MGKRISEHRGVNIFLAILIAVALWAYVTTVVYPDASKTIRDTGVTFLGEEILNAKGLMIDPSTDVKLDMTITGNRNTLLRVSEVLITAEVSSISAAGEYTLPCRIAPPNGVTVENGTSQTIRIRVIKMLSKTVDVRGSVTGTLPEGYRANDFAITPSTITIYGPESLVNQIEFAQVMVSGSNLTKTYTNDLGFEFVATGGETISSEQITSSAETVNIILPVVKTLEVPLVVEFINGGGAVAENVEYTITPSSIQISGGEEDVTALKDKSITLGVIDLSKVGDSDTLSFPIALALELTNDSGVSEAEVTFKITGLSTKSFETTNIEVINPPVGYTATPVTQSLQIRVRGTEEALAEVYSYKLRVVVDMKDQEFSPGQFRLPAKVYLDMDGQVGVVGEYYIVVSVSNS